MAKDQNGLPVLDGIWHRNRLLIRYRDITDATGTRSLEFVTTLNDFRPPRENARYQTLIHDEQPCPALNGRVLCGTLRTDQNDLGFVMVTSGQGVEFVASFRFARPFIGIEVHGAHILVKNASGETWRFDVSDPEYVTAEILP